MPPTVRDRTREFFATVDSFQQHGQNTSKRPTPSKSHSKLPKTSIEESSRIRNLATNIAENIGEAQQKILELEQFAKLTSNFRDERPKIQSLMFTIKTDIEALSENLKVLNGYIGQSFSSLYSDHHCIGHHKSLLNVLNSRYCALVKSFAFACEVSTKHLQRQKREREKLGFGSNKKTSFRKVPLNRLQKRNVMSNNTDLPHRHKSTASGRMHPSLNRNRMRRRNKNQNGSNSENELLLGNDALNGHQLKGASQSQSQMMVYKDNNYADQKVQEAEHIETQLTEISQMMTKLANIVDEQRQTIIQIGDNVEDSIQHVEGAVEQLQKYLASLSGNRWLMIKVFALLIFLAIIFTIFIA